MAAADRLPPDPPGDAAHGHGHRDQRPERRAQVGEPGPPGPGEHPGRDREARDRVGRVHERDDRDARDGGERRPARVADLEPEEEQRRRREHPQRERRRLVDLKDEPVDERAQVPRRHRGGQVAGRAPAGERLGERVRRRDRKPGAQRQQVAERDDRVGAGELRHALERGVQDRQCVAGVGGPCRNGETFANDSDGASPRRRMSPTWKSASPTTGVEIRQARYANAATASRAAGDLEHPGARQGDRRADGEQEERRSPQHGRDDRGQREAEQICGRQRRRPDRERERRRDRRGAGPSQVALEADRAQGAPSRREQDEPGGRPDGEGVPRERAAGRKARGQRDQGDQFRASGGHRGGMLPTAVAPGR